MVEVKWNTDHHLGANAEQRIKNRLKPSSPTGGQEQKETNPVRTVTTVLYGGSQAPCKGDK